MICTTVPDANGETLLAVQARAVGRGAQIVDARHWGRTPQGGQPPSHHR